MRDEEALSSGYRQVPSVFSEVETYHAIPAKVTSTAALTSNTSKPIDAIPSVVQIFSATSSAATRRRAAGVIVHPSGLILTALHVLLKDPNNLRSREYDDFVIALTETHGPGRARSIRARSVADLDELDIALLAIDRDLDGEAIDAETLNLPALPFADVDQLFADTLLVLGFPQDGGAAVNYTPATFKSFDEDGQLIVVDKALGKGNSGGPALVLQDGRLAIAGLVIRGRTTQGRSGAGWVAACYRPGISAGLDARIWAGAGAGCFGRRRDRRRRGYASALRRSVDLRSSRRHIASALLCDRVRHRPALAT